MGCEEAMSIMVSDGMIKMFAKTCLVVLMMQELKLWIEGLKISLLEGIEKAKMPSGDKRFLIALKNSRVNRRFNPRAEGAGIFMIIRS